jgi:NADPH2:quinone reductase
MINSSHTCPIPTHLLTPPSVSPARSDTYQRLGPAGPWGATPHLLPKPPFTPGNDGAGVVTALGPGVDPAAIAVGDRVYTLKSTTGTYSEHALCNATDVYPLPDNISFEQGACIGVPCSTAFRALKHRCPVKAGDRVFVHGASGAVGLAAVQLARAWGCFVVGTAGSEPGLAAVRAAGAHVAVNHREEG